MRYLILTFAFLIALLPLQATALTGEATRFDFVLGEPAVTDDSTSACTNEAEARFDFVLGEPAVVHDATATCTAAAAGTTDQGVIWFNTE